MDQLSFDIDEYVVFDIETTGLSAWGGDEIIEIGAMKVFGQKVDESETFHSLVNPKRSIPEEASRINGITSEMLMGAPVIEEVLPKFLDFVGNARLVAQNSKFDMSFVMKYLIRLNLRHEFEVFDTMILSRRAFPDAPRHSLDMIAKRLDLKITPSERHRSIGDVRLTARAFVLLRERLGTQSPSPEKWSC